MSDAFVFVPSEFREQYPKFTEEVISDEALTALYDSFNAMVGDGEGHFLYKPETVKTIVFTAICHLATLHTSDLDQPARVSSASQGSTSTSFENLQSGTESGQFWNLTRCGALFWVLTLPYRSGCRMYGQRRYHPYG